MEIANFTGASVNLSAYTIKINANGASSWGSAQSFPGGAAIANGDVYVIANGGSNICTSEYDYLNNSMTSFNGNDAVGLFKNDVLIDIIGVFQNDAVFAQNTTLVRKPIVDRPTTTFDINEWNVFPSDNCDDLGDHTQTLSLTENNLEDFKVYPNPVQGNKVYVTTNQSLEFEIYNILGKLICKGLVDNGVLSVQTLKTGVYILKLSNGNQVITKKLIKE